MHVHLPKPLHGWRQFAGEVAIIVRGILIALAMEQIAQQWHDSLEGQRHLLDATDARMRSVLSQARYADWSIGLFFVQVIDDAKSLGITPSFGTTHAKKLIYLPIGTSRESALKLADPRFGAP